jgi:hypothetical protein
MYYLDGSNSLIIADQKATRDLYLARPRFIGEYPNVHFGIYAGVSTLSNGTDDQYCAILSQLLRCSPIGLDLFRNNMKKAPVKPAPEPFVAPPPVHNSQPSVRREFGTTPDKSPEIPADSLPHPAPFRIERRKPSEKLVFTKPAFNLIKPQEITGVPEPPPLQMPIGFEFPSIPPDTAFSVAPLPFSAHTDPPQKVPSQFSPEPIFDSIWKTPKIPSQRKLAKAHMQNAPVMTRKMVLALTKTAREKKRIARLYPFLKAKELAVLDGDDDEEGDLLNCPSGERPASYRPRRNGRGEEPPRETHSLPGGGSRKRTFR